MDYFLYLVFLIGNSCIWGAITRKVSDCKGYYGGFGWGFWLGWIGLIVVCCRPNLNEEIHERKGWRCACGREHSDYVTTCSCGMQRTGLATVPVSMAPQALSNGQWTCSCGRTHQSYVSSCVCGQTKPAGVTPQPKPATYQPAQNPQVIPHYQTVPQYQTTVPQYQTVPTYQTVPQQQTAPAYQAAPRQQAAPAYQAAPQQETAPLFQAAPQPQTAPQYQTVPPYRTVQPAKPTPAAAQPAPAVAQPTPATLRGEENTIAVLKEYKALLDDAIITQEEFEAKKKQLLGQ